MPEAVDTNEVKVTLVHPRDADHLNRIAQNLLNPAVAYFWEDRMRLDPAATFLRLFANPEGAMAFDIGDGDGVIVVTKQGHRGTLLGASWGRRAMGRKCIPARRQCYRAAMEALGLAVIEGQTRHDNIAAQKAMESSGFRFFTNFPGGMWYNKEQVDGVIYEIRREDLDLPPL